MALEDHLNWRLTRKEPLQPEITDAALKSVIRRFLAPEGAPTAPDLLTGNRGGFGELSWVSHAIKTDPALNNKPQAAALDEVLLYPGLQALALHRVAHELYASGNPRDQVKARAISQAAKQHTGIEIHPGATIGKHLFIDHGAGVIIGQQAVIGDHVKLYQGVTIGGDDKPLASGKRRHPTLGDGVIIDSGAKLLGPAVISNGVRISSDAQVIGAVTIGTNSRVAADATVRIDVPANVVVTTDNHGWHTIRHADGTQQSVNPFYRDRDKAAPLTAGEHGWRRKLEQEEPAAFSARTK
jgi:serine O-acetyltransferase